ncbi:MAG: 2-dehydropantoate 2-reductase [Paraglaciecola sp.]|jgi:2-dehydropantoate 2-reductase
MQKYLPQNKKLKGMRTFNVISSDIGHFHCGTKGNFALEDPENRAGYLLQALEQAFVGLYFA